MPFYTNHLPLIGFDLVYLDREWETAIANRKKKLSIVAIDSH